MEFKNTIWTHYEKFDDWEDENGKPMSYEAAEELHNEYLEDERMNLDVSAGGQIVCLASLGLWDGRRDAHKILGSKASYILEPQMDGMSYCSWGSDGKDIVGEEAHHDGTNYYTYRVLKGDTYGEQMENCDKLFSKTVTPQRIGRYTKSLLPVVAEVYGWK